jgi:hypothetical protein
MPLSREDRRLTGFLLLAVALAAAFAAVDAAFFRYTGICYFPLPAWPLAGVALYLAYSGRAERFESPRTRFLVKNCALYALAHVALALYVSGLQFTPFPPIDRTLKAWDNVLGFDTASALAWTASHPNLRAFLRLCYMSTDAQLALAPLVAGFAFDRKRMRIYLYSFVFSFLAGGFFYYFFPSSGPAGVYESRNFLDVQLLTTLKFYEVHHFLPVLTIQGGMIAFPSFHVAWAVLTTYAALPSRRLFPFVAALNVLVVASTVLLGWHYLVDVPAGLALAGLGLWAASVAAA